MINEEVCQPHHIVSPREEDREECPYQKSPLQWPLDNECSEDEEEEHESPHVDRTSSEGLVTPIVVETSQYLLVVRGDTLHRIKILFEFSRCTTIGIRHK